MVKKSYSNLDPDSILVICAHSDDQIFGPGGTLIKYASEGKKIYTVILSYGEASHPLFQKKITITTRVKEALDVDKFIGGSGVVFLGLTEGKFLEEFKEKKVYPKLKKLIEKYRPSRIFTHSIDDPQVYLYDDHRQTNKCVIETVDKMKYKGEVYMFDIWTLFNLKKRHYVSIIVDISKTFDTKIKALKLFKSQAFSLFSLTWSVYLKGWITGSQNNMKFAEKFYKIR